MSGIQNILEIAQAIEDGALLYSQVMDDGKIGFTDLPRIFAYLSSLKLAVADADEIPSELGDLDSGEVSQIAGAFYSALLAWADVVKR